MFSPCDICHDEQKSENWGFYLFFSSYQFYCITEMGFSLIISIWSKVLQLAAFNDESPCFHCGLLTHWSVGRDVLHEVNSAGFVHQLWCPRLSMREPQVYFCFCFALLQREMTDNGKWLTSSWLITPVKPDLTLLREKNPNLNLYRKYIHLTKETQKLTSDWFFPTSHSKVSL